MNQEPAFPCLVGPEYQEYRPGNFTYQAQGLSVRDYFAAKAMQALIEKTELMMQAVLEDASHHGDSGFILQKHREGVCSSAYAYADQMLLQRNEISGA